MRSVRLTLFSAGLLTLAIPASARPIHAHGKSATHLTVKHESAHSKTVSGKAHLATHAATSHMEGATAMPSERATEIQSALIKQGYMTGEPTGSWDPQTVTAMQKMQEDNGWQSKITPDSRALIKLGLGGPSPIAEAAPTPQQ
jgi:hypothetical protein